MPSAGGGLRSLSMSRRPPRARGVDGGGVRVTTSSRVHARDGASAASTGRQRRMEVDDCGGSPPSARETRVLGEQVRDELSPAPADRHPRPTVMTAGCGVAGGHGAGRGPSAGGVALLLALTARTPVGTVPAATIVMRLSSWGSPPLDHKVHMTRPSIPWRKSRCPTRPLCTASLPSGVASEWGRGRLLTTARVWTWTR